MYTDSFESISSDQLVTVAGGQAAAPQAPQAPAPQRQHPADYSTNGNVLQQSGQGVMNAYEAFQGARKGGASWYESIGNAAIGAFNLQGGFDRNGNPR